MDANSLNELEIASPEVIRRAVQDFAEAVAESQVFKSFEGMTMRYRNDPDAQADMAAYRDLQQSLRMKLRTNSFTPAEKAELERLHGAWLSHESVMEYLEAQQELVATCQSPSVTFCLKKPTWIFRRRAATVAADKEC